MASREINSDRVKGLYRNPICPDMSNTIGSALWVIKWEIFRLLKDLRGQSLNWEMIQIDKDPLSWSRHVHPESLKSGPSVPQVGRGRLEFWIIVERDLHYVAYIYQQYPINSTFYAYLLICDNLIKVTYI